MAPIVQDISREIKTDSGLLVKKAIPWDSLLIIRENLLNSFIGYYLSKFNYIPEIDKIESIAKIISYNVFQMDGLKYTLPVVEKIRSKKLDVQLSFFGEEVYFNKVYY